MEAETAMRRYGIDPEVPYMLFVGRIARQKGIIHLVNAIQYMDAGVPGGAVRGGAGYAGDRGGNAGGGGGSARAAGRGDLDPGDGGQADGDPTVLACGDFLLSVDL